jgi:PAS domain S-box-containing protein
MKQTEPNLQLPADDTVVEDAIVFLGPDGEIRATNDAGEKLARRFPKDILQVAARDGRVEIAGHVVISALRDDAGELTGFTAVTRGARKRNVGGGEVLRQSEEIFHLLVASVKDYAIFLLDPDGRVMTWNAGAQRMKGYRADEIIGRHFSTFYPEIDIRNQKPQRELEDALRNGSVEDEGWRVRKDGTLFWANVVITSVYDEEGVLRGFAKVTRDLTQRRKSEEHLRQSEEMFRLLVDSVGEYAIFLLDAEGNIVTWNAGAQRIKGYRPEEIIGRHFSTFYTEEDLRDEKPRHELEIAAKTGSVEDNGWRVRKDGTRFWANVVITAVHDEHGELRGFAKVTRDMTERKRADELRQALFEQREARFQAEEERRRTETSYHAAQEANRAKDEFLMTLSHELRTPLTAIIGWSRLLPTMEPSDSLFAEAISAIGRSAQVQARLIDDVLDVSRIVSGKLRLQIENVELLKLLLESIDAVRPSAEAKGITVTTLFSPDLGTITADSTRLQQVVWNLLTNAVKFTPKGGRISIIAQRTPTHIQIEVSDSGEGIEPTFLPHVFQPFRQAENPSTRVHGGLGLGLSIVRYLVDAHGGTVSATSEGRGRGATFTITFPLSATFTQATPEQPATPAPPHSNTLPQRLDGTTILLIDDDIEGRKLVRAVLRRAGANVRDVDSGEHAFHALREELPHLVVTDIAMPHMDGYAVAHRIREIAPTMKIVALTAFPASRAAARDAIFDAYITKPVEPADLIESVANVLAPPPVS